MNVSVNDDVQLQKAEHAWKPGMKRETLAEDLETQKTQVRSYAKPLPIQYWNTECQKCFHPGVERSVWFVLCLLKSACLALPETCALL